MCSRSEHEKLVEPSSYRDLQLLSKVDENPEVTQRELSLRAGIALGLTNVLLRNLTQKGYLRITKSGWRRWIYHLTPKGVFHKVRLTVAYINRVLDHYQKVRQTLREELEPLALTKESRVAIYGTEEFAELVYLGLRELGIEEIDIYDKDAIEGSRFLGMPVHDLKSIRPDSHDQIVVATTGDTKVPLAEILEIGVSLQKVVTFFNGGNAGRNH